MPNSVAEHVRRTSARYGIVLVNYDSTDERGQFDYLKSARRVLMKLGLRDPTAQSLVRHSLNNNPCRQIRFNSFRNHCYLEV